MKSVFYFFSSIISLIDLNGQSMRRFVIVDDSLHQPLPYATIRFSNKNIGFYANEQGEAITSVSSNDTLLVSFVGFKEKKIGGTSLHNDTIALTINSPNLTEIIIKTNRIIGSPQNIGYTNEKTSFKTGSMVAVEFAVRINLPKEYNLFKVNQIILPLQKTNSNNPVRVHLYEVNSNMEPGDEILKDDILITKINSNGNLHIDVSHQEITTSSKFLFVGLEWVGNSAANTMLGPYTRFTTSLKEAQTYTRTINDIAHKWVKFALGPSKNGNPSNFIAGLVVQPLEN